MRLEVAEIQIVPLPQLIQQAMLGAQLRGQFIDNVNVLRAPRQIAEQDQRAGAADVDANALARPQFRADLPKKLANSLRPGGFHQTPFQRRESRLSQVLTPNRLDGRADNTGL